MTYYAVRTPAIPLIFFALTYPLAACERNVNVPETIERGKAEVERHYKGPLPIQWGGVFLSQPDDGSFVVCGSLMVPGPGSLPGLVGDTWRSFYVTVSVEKDPGAAAIEDTERRPRNDKTNLANPGKGLSEIVRTDPRHMTRSFFEGYEEMCLRGTKRTYVKK